ncbi:MAG TPA: transcriptional repressor [Acidimicrobiales bacterium]|nr:transcriptional repressor [Acidimicrobiales bacterium]
MTAAPAAVHEAVAAALADSEQRYTAGRRSLVDVLAAAGRPLSIAEVVGRSASMPQSSVYRNLAVLTQAGAVRRVASADERARFELAEALTEHHHHLVCVGCGTVDDYTPPMAVERSVVRAIVAVTASTGFQPQGHRLDVLGLCERCA